MTGEAPDSAPRSDPALIFGDALAPGDQSGGYPDALGDTLGDAAGGMIGGISADALVIDVFGAAEPADGYASANAGYGDALSVTIPPARADTPPEPAEPAAAPVPSRRKPAAPDGVLRPPGWRPDLRSAGQRARPASRPTSRRANPVRPTTRPATTPPGTVPGRVSRSAADLPSGEGRFRWAGRGILALVVAGLVIGNVVHGCASGLTGH